MAESGASPGPAQLHALFDILTHAETYREIEGFKHADAVAEYGYPFAQGDGSGFAPRSGSPLLQMLNRKFVMSLPPARALPLEFWNVRVQGIIAGFADAELSESYDKGAVGTRKNLATASSAFIEAAARGCLGGCSPSSSGHAFSGGLAGRTYDVEDARDLARSWDDVVREMVYGRLLDELFDHATKTADIEAHSPAIVAAVDCIIIQYGCPIFCFPLRVSNNRFRLSHRDGTCCTALGWPVSCIRYASCRLTAPISSSCSRAPTGWCPTRSSDRRSALATPPP